MGEFKFTTTLLLGLAIAIPILLIGGASAIKIIGFVFSPTLGTGIPVWVIFVGIIIYVIFKRRSQY